MPRAKRRSPPSKRWGGASSDDGEHAALVQLYLSAADLPYPKERRPRAAVRGGVPVLGSAGRRRSGAQPVPQAVRRRFGPTRLPRPWSPASRSCSKSRSWTPRSPASGRTRPGPGPGWVTLAPPPRCSRAPPTSPRAAWAPPSAPSTTIARPPIWEASRRWTRWPASSTLPAGTPDAAAALERLCERSSRDELGARTLRLAEAHLRAGQPDLARARLEHAVAHALDAGGVRQRLAELYRTQRARLGRWPSS
jgi:hypothetical protein